MRNASLTLAGSLILVGNDIGETLVMAAEKEFKQLAINRLGKGSGACPMPHDRMLLLRGGTALYCIGAAEPK